MTDFALDTPTRRCAATGRGLTTGEKYYGVLREEAAKYVRSDFAPEAWNGPPEDAAAYWSGRVPAEESPRRPPIDDDDLLDRFNQLEGAVERSRLGVRYVLGLLLMRRKRLKLAESRSESQGDTLCLVDARTRERHEVRDPGLTARELSAVQDEVFQLLGWN